MMMNRSHQENPLTGSRAPAGELEIIPLDQHRYRFHYENPAGDDKDQRLMDQHSHDSQRTTQSERTGVAHEHLRRMAVEPKKSQAGADDRRAKDRKFTSATDRKNLQIARDLHVAR